MRDRSIEETNKARRENVEWIYDNINRGEGLERRILAKKFWNDLPHTQPEDSKATKQLQQVCRKWLFANTIQDAELSVQLENAAMNTNAQSWISLIPEQLRTNIWNCKNLSQKSFEKSDGTTISEFDGTTISAFDATTDALERFEHLARLIEIEAFSTDVIQRFFYTTLVDSFVEFSPQIYFHRKYRDKSQYSSKFEIIARWAAGVIERREKKILKTREFLK